MPWRSSTLSSSRSVMVTPSRKLLRAASCSAASAGTASMARWKLSPTLTMSLANLVTAYLAVSSFSRSDRLRMFSTSAWALQQPVLEVGGLGLQGDDHVVRRALRRLGAGLLGRGAGVAAGSRRTRAGGALPLCRDRRAVYRPWSLSRDFLAAPPDKRDAIGNQLPATALVHARYHAVAAKNQVSRRPTSLAV